MKNKKNDINLAVIILYSLSIFFALVFVFNAINHYINRDSLVTVDLGFAIRLDVFLYLLPSLILLIIAIAVHRRKGKK